MSRSEYSYFTGTSQELTDFRSQLNRLYIREGLAVIGSVGRAAMYENYGFEAPPLPLWNRVGQSRDIDVLLPNRFFYDEDSVPGPHKIDWDLNGFFEQEAHRTLVHKDFEEAEVDPIIFETQTRTLHGAQVHTYKVGTQLELERFFTSAQENSGQYDTAKYVRSMEIFTAFAEELQHSHPEEFLPSELYRPLREI